VPTAYDLGEPIFFEAQLRQAILNGTIFCVYLRHVQLSVRTAETSGFYTSNQEKKQEAVLGTDARQGVSIPLSLFVTFVSPLLG